MAITVIPAGGTLKTHTQTISESKYGSGYSWVNFDMAVPEGTLGMIEYNNGGGPENGAGNAKIQNGRFYTSVWTGKSGRTVTVSVNLLVQD